MLFVHFTDIIHGAPSWWISFTLNIKFARLYTRKPLLTRVLRSAAPVFPLLLHQLLFLTPVSLLHTNFVSPGNGWKTVEAFRFKLQQVYRFSYLEKIAVTQIIRACFFFTMQLGTRNEGVWMQEDDYKRDTGGWRRNKRSFVCLSTLSVIGQRL